MTRLLPVLLAALLSMPLYTSATSIAPPDRSVAQSQGFVGKVLATTDKDWLAKWDTPPETTPKFTPAVRVGLGQEASVLIFFTNPALNAQGLVDLSCDITVLNPSGKVEHQSKDVACFKGKIADPGNVYLSQAVLKVIPEKGDPSGVLTIKVVLRDKVRGASVSLETSFEQVAE